MSASNVPALVKHTVVAIHGKLKGQGDKERAISAWNIARARLVEYGFLTKGAENASSESLFLHLTSKGTLRNREHRLESKNPVVDREFAQLFEHVEPAETPSVQPKEPVKTNTEDKRQDYEEKQKTDSTELVTELLKRAKKQEKDPSKKKRKDQL